MSAFLDIAIGLIVVLLVFSIIVSGINEWIAQAFCRRGHHLRRGIQRLIDDDAIYRRVINHPLISSLYRDAESRSNPPSYIEPASFALALVDVLRTRAAAGSGCSAQAAVLAMADLQVAINSENRANSPLRVALLPIIERAGNDLEATLKGIEAWYSAAMDRVGGWYKADTQRMVFLIGLTLAAVGNVDMLEIYASLSGSPQMRASLITAGLSMNKTEKIGAVDLTMLKDHAPTDEQWRSLLPLVERIATEQSLPIGYACLNLAQKPLDGSIDPSANKDAGTLGACREDLASFWNRPISAWILKLFGWLLTAFAGTLGSTYWFDLLGKAINLRGAGTRPAPSKPLSDTERK